MRNEKIVACAVLDRSKIMDEKRGWDEVKEKYKKLDYECTTMSTTTTTTTMYLLSGRYYQ